MLYVPTMYSSDNKEVHIRLRPKSRAMLADLVESGDYTTMTAAAADAIRRLHEARKEVSI